MSKWVKLDVAGPPCEINKQGDVRRKKIILAGKEFTDFTRVPSTTRQGYLYLAFIVEGKQKNYFIHRLVATTFILNPENKPFVNHIDGNKQNNKVSNLEWVTASENMQHASKTGLLTIHRGEQHKQSILTNDNVREIKKRLNNGDSQRAIAIDFNVHFSLISHIKAGRKWGDIN